MAAHRLRRSNGAGFSAGDLAVLVGDRKLAALFLLGPEGLVDKGLVERSVPRRFRLTRRGRALAHGLEDLRP